MRGDREYRYRDKAKKKRTWRHRVAIGSSMASRGCGRIRCFLHIIWTHLITVCEDKQTDRNTGSDWGGGDAIECSLYICIPIATYVSPLNSVGRWWNASRTQVEKKNEGTEFENHSIYIYMYIYIYIYLPLSPSQTLIFSLFFTFLSSTFTYSCLMHYFSKYWYLHMGGWRGNNTLY